MASSGGSGWWGSGGGGSAKGRREQYQEEELYTTDKKGVKIYANDAEDIEKIKKAYKAFDALSQYKCVWNKGFEVIKDTGKTWSMKSMKRSQQWDYLKDHNIHAFKFEVAVGDEKRALKLMEDYGYHVKAALATNKNAKSISAIKTYYLAKKEMQRLTLDFKVETYYKRGWRG